MVSVMNSPASSELDVILPGEPPRRCAGRLAAIIRWLLRSQLPDAGYCSLQIDLTPDRASYALTRTTRESVNRVSVA